MCQAQKSYERCTFKLTFLVEQLRLREVSNFSEATGLLHVGAHARATEREIVVSRTKNFPSTGLGKGHG